MSMAMLDSLAVDAAATNAAELAATGGPADTATSPVSGSA
jgi:hypothetical protein